MPAERRNGAGQGSPSSRLATAQPAAAPSGHRLMGLRAPPSRTRLVRTAELGGSTKSADAATARCAGAGGAGAGSQGRERGS